MGYEDVEAAQDAKLAALNQEKGRLQAMLEVQEWAEAHQNALIKAGVYAALLRLTVPE